MLFSFFNAVTYFVSLGLFICQKSSITAVEKQQVQEIFPKGSNSLRKPFRQGL